MRRRPVDNTIQASLQRGSRTVRRVLTEDDQERLRQDLADGHRGVPRVGSVIAGAVPSLPYLVVDSSGDPVDPVSRYLRDRMLGDVSPLTCRGYAHDLLRWFRLLWLLEIAWDKGDRG